MRKILMIALLSISVSLIATSLPAAQNTCPIPESQLFDPNAPPPGWILFVADPSITGGTYYRTTKAKNYLLTSLIYSLDSQFFQKIFCLYKQNIPCPPKGCSYFALQSTTSYTHITPSIKSTYWYPFTKLENNSVFCTQPILCKFDNNPG